MPPAVGGIGQIGRVGLGRVKRGAAAPPSGDPGAGVDNLLLESGDNLLLESSEEDVLVLE
jgi:hypothetical protein